MTATSRDYTSDVAVSSHTRQPIMYECWEFAYALCKAIGQKAPVGTIALVVGAGGCGKSSMWSRLAESIYGEPNGWRFGQLPAIKVSADNPDRGYFSSKALMKELLCSVRDPFRGLRLRLADLEIDELLKHDLALALSTVRSIRDREPDLRESFISIAKAAGVKLILVDEANLLCLTQRTRVPTDYLESLRRLAERVGCRIILFGTIELLQMVDYSGQLNRRTRHIHIDRMRCETKEGALVFISFLHDLEIDMRLPIDLLTSHVSQVYANTYGIPGEVVGLVERADEIRQALEAPIIEWRHIERAFPIPDVVARMRDEADLIAEVMSGIKTGDQKKPTGRTTPRRRSAKPKRHPVGAPIL